MRVVWRTSLRTDLSRFREQFLNASIALLLILRRVRFRLRKQLNDGQSFVESSQRHHTDIYVGDWLLLSKFECGRTAGLGGFEERSWSHLTVGN